jgi:hypothetical protein
MKIPFNIALVPPRAPKMLYAKSSQKKNPDHFEIILIMLTTKRKMVKEIPIPALIANIKEITKQKKNKSNLTIQSMYSFEHFVIYD